MISESELAKIRIEASLAVRWQTELNTTKGEIKTEIESLKAWLDSMAVDVSNENYIEDHHRLRPEWLNTLLDKYEMLSRELFQYRKQTQGSAESEEV